MDFANEIPSNVPEKSNSGQVEIPFLNQYSNTDATKNGPKRTQRTGRLLSWKNMAADYWWEVGSATLSMATFLLIISILLVYDQKPAPSLPRGITVRLPAACWSQW